MGDLSLHFLDFHVGVRKPLQRWYKTVELNLFFDDDGYHFRVNKNSLFTNILSVCDADLYGLVLAVGEVQFTPNCL